MTKQMPSVEQLGRALKIAEQIQRLEQELASLLGSQASSPAIFTPVANGNGSRVLSNAGRERIAAAQRLRWAKARAAKVKSNGATKPAREKQAVAASAPKPAAAKKSTISPETRAKLVAAAKRRWSKR